MHLNPKSRRPVGRQVATPARSPRTHGPNEGLSLPHERDQATPSIAEAPDAVIEQAKRDLDAGMVDTDMRATAGLDAERRARLNPGPGGKPPSRRQP
jgi:hypothetical protein